MSPRKCLHAVAMKYTCAICFGEFKTLRIRRLKTHIEEDWDPLLQQLDPQDGPLTFLMRQMKFQSAGKLTGVQEHEDTSRVRKYHERKLCADVVDAIGNDPDVDAEVPF